jgi:hypothetical protein
MTLANPDIVAIRSVLANIDPKSSSIATQPLSIEELYTPASHALALDPTRPLVVGNRGVGKTVWSGVLADPQTRKEVAKSYPDLGLDRMTVELGFHEATGQVEGVAPSPRILASILEEGSNAEAIWTAVLLRAVAPTAEFVAPKSLAETVRWYVKNIEEAEQVLRKADQKFARENRRFVLVFDALDRLAPTWAEIRPLTVGILRLTLDMQGYRAMRSKVFMRTDQAKDETLFRFPDASKLRAARVDLTWHATELFGLLFKSLRQDAKSHLAFDRLVKKAIGRGAREDITEPEQQKAVFNLIAGEFMGTDRRRGRTYTWLIDHLADAFGETTPRSFLITLNRAARARYKPQITVIDHAGIREGVQEASKVRVEQLQEDYPWIPAVLKDLEGLEVPSTPASFVRRWQDRKTVDGVLNIANKEKRPGPIELEHSSSRREVALLEALKNIGVVEERSADRINMPDIFRVAASIKRRGGVRPPISGMRRSAR